PLPLVGVVGLVAVVVASRRGRTGKFHFKYTLKIAIGTTSEAAMNASNSYLYDKRGFWKKVLILRCMRCILWDIGDVVNRGLSEWMDIELDELNELNQRP